MGASINLSNIKSIYYNGSKIKTVYYGNTVVYQSDSTSISTDINPWYNYFVFDSHTVELDASRNGDITSWHGETDWGDGIVDNLLTHTYTSGGPHTVKTKWAISDSSKLSLIKCENINKNMTNAKSLFRDCKRLESVDLTNLNQDITDLSYMFYGCKKLTNVYNINTSNITDMSYMFYECDSLDGSQFTGWDVSKVEKMSYMFKGATITNCLDLSSWNVSNVIYMIEMFNQCYAEDFIDISNWKLRTDMITEWGVSFFAPRVLSMFAFTYCDGICRDVEHHVIHNNVSNNDWNKMKSGQY